MEKLTNYEIFRQKQADMSNDELIKLCQSELSKLCKTGGNSFRMCIPLMVTDTDILFQELLDRFTELNK